MGQDAAPQTRVQSVSSIAFRILFIQQLLTNPLYFSVLQRFYHQQNQLRDKIGDERQAQGSADYASLDCPDNSNPFLEGPYSPREARKKYQTIRSRNNFDHSKNMAPGGAAESLEHGPSGYGASKEAFRFNSKGTESISTTTTYVTTHLNLRTVTSPPPQQQPATHYESNGAEKEILRTVRNEEFMHESSSSSAACDTDADGRKVAYEKNLGKSPRD